MSYPRFSILSFGIVLNDVGTVCKQNKQVYCFKQNNFVLFVLRLKPPARTSGKELYLLKADEGISAVS